LQLSFGHLLQFTTEHPSQAPPLSQWPEVQLVQVAALSQVVQFIGQAVQSPLLSQKPSLHSSQAVGEEHLMQLVSQATHV
jgi:hypothetical protein